MYSIVSRFYFKIYFQDSVSTQILHVTSSDINNNYDYQYFSNFYCIINDWRSVFGANNVCPERVSTSRSCSIFQATQLNLVPGWRDRRDTGNDQQDRSPIWTGTSCDCYGFLWFLVDRIWRRELIERSPMSSALEFSRSCRNHPEEKIHPSL